MDWTLGVFAGLFYVPTIAYAIWKGRSWVDILVVGIILAILATGVNGLLPPWGTVGFAITHVLLIGLVIRAVAIAKQTKTSEKK